jgi:hypothetical protein
MGWRWRAILDARSASKGFVRFREALQLSARRTESSGRRLEAGGLGGAGFDGTRRTPGVRNLACALSRCVNCVSLSPLDARC